jgi:hypothetical protein
MYTFSYFSVLDGLMANVYVLGAHSDEGCYPLQGRKDVPLARDLLRLHAAGDDPGARRDGCYCVRYRRFWFSSIFLVLPLNAGMGAGGGLG